jgi:anti-sigma regulatory factor (Ser/Thr protein kinase)
VSAFEVGATSELAGLRAEVTALAQRWGLHEDMIADLLVVVTELAVNAIEAAPPGRPVAVEVECEDGVVVVSVEDEGPGFEFPSLSLPGPESARGRGLLLARALTDDMSVGRIEGRTRVTAMRSFVPAD